MHRLIALVSLAVLAHSSCRREDPPAPPAPSASVTASAAARFEVVDVLDFGRRKVRTFAFSSATQQLFVSFSDEPDRERMIGGDPLFQYDLAASKLAFTYRPEPGWMIDGLHALPGGRRVVVALFKLPGSDAGPHWEKFLLLDVERRIVLSVDLGVYDERRAEVDLGRSGERLRITTHPPGGPAAARFVFDLAGRPAQAAADEFPPRSPGPLSVIESSKSTLDTAGLYYTDPEGHRHVVARDHWHDNYALSRDGEYVVTTTWDGEVIAFGTREKTVIYREKIASRYGYLAYDAKNDRFLLGDATHDGTTKLRALRRASLSR